MYKVFLRTNNYLSVNHPI